MFPKALLAIAPLVIQTAAVPVERSLGISIPLHSRSSLITPEGVFDHAKAVRAFVRTQNKYRRNTTSPPANTTATNPFEVSKRQNLPLTNLQEDRAWAGTVSVGTPPVEFLIDFDSTRLRRFRGCTIGTHQFFLAAGGSGFWLPSVDCNVAACANKHKYDPSKSSTSKHMDEDFKAAYGTGSVSGLLFTETVEIANIRVTEQIFSPVTAMDAFFGELPIDGVTAFLHRAICKIANDDADSRFGIQ
jgi:cathepsin D